MDGYVSYRFFPFENLRVGTNKDQIFVFDFTFEKCGSCGVMFLFLGGKPGRQRNSNIPKEVMMAVLGMSSEAIGIW